MTVILRSDRCDHAMIVMFTHFNSKAAAAIYSKESTVT